ncbi:hypothetical protein J8J40_26275, partial [Mycobacterium tuberculosis]|nr:hypothetical protein [Mycobacterium tuberculosis]
MQERPAADEALGRVVAVDDAVEALQIGVALLLAARREALTWFRTRSEDTANAYWSYLKRYPDGAHAADARRRLARLAAAAEPPARFEEIVYD